MANKKELKELQAPDELQKLGQQAVPFLEQHGKNIVLGLLGVLAVVGGGSLIFHIADKAQEAATVQYGAALSVVTRDVNTSAPAEAPKDQSAPPFKSEQDKDEAIIEKLTAFRKENTGKKAATSAALPLAQALLRRGRASEALPLAEEFLRDSAATDPLRPVALETRGYALEATGKLDEALAAFERLSKENETEFLKGMGDYHRARVLEAKSDLTGAMKAYSDVSTSAPDSSAARLAKERMGLLAAKGIALPAPVAPAAVTDAGM